MVPGQQKFIKEQKTVLLKGKRKALDTSGFLFVMLISGI